MYIYTPQRPECFVQLKTGQNKQVLAHKGENYFRARRTQEAQENPITGKLALAQSQVQ